MFYRQKQLFGISEQLNFLSVLHAKGMLRIAEINRLQCGFQRTRFIGIELAAYQASPIISVSGDKASSRHGEFNCAPNAKVDDGLIEVCLFRAMSLLRLLMLIPLYRKGEHIGSKLGKGKVIYRQAREVEVSSKDLIDVYLDGEQLLGSHFEMKILHGALPLRLPPLV